MPVKVKCDNCGKIIEKPKCHVKEHNFCNRDCYNSWRRKQGSVTVKCDYCGKKFTKRKSQVKNNNYCSNECKFKARKDRIKLVCEYCGKSYSVIKSRAEESRFCSKECHNKWMSESEEWSKKYRGKHNPMYGKEPWNKGKKISKLLGEEAKRKMFEKMVTTRRERGNYKHSKENIPKIVRGIKNYWEGKPTPKDVREKISKTLQGRYTGKSNPNWRGGYEPYYGPNWREQRREARKRDNYTCQICGKTEEEMNKELDVHHITPFREFDNYKEANKLSNLISLCHSCHISLEGGKKSGLRTS